MVPPNIVFSILQEEEEPRNDSESDELIQRRGTEQGHLGSELQGDKPGDEMSEAVQKVPVADVDSLESPRIAHLEPSSSPDLRTSTPRGTAAIVAKFASGNVSRGR